MTNNHLSPRTIREWLELIPFDRARKEAIENTRQSFKIKYDITVSFALYVAFDWSNSIQGNDYWYDLHKALKNMEQSVRLK